MCVCVRVCGRLSIYLAPGEFHSTLFAIERRAEKHFTDCTIAVNTAATYVCICIYMCTHTHTHSQIHTVAANWTRDEEATAMPKISKVNEDKKVIQLKLR